MVNLTGSVPLAVGQSPTPLPDVEIIGDEHPDGQEMEGRATAAASPGKSQITEMQAVEMITEPEAVPLVVPAALFKPVSYHPMHIFVSVTGQHR